MSTAITDQPLLNFTEAQKITGSFSILFYIMIFIFPYIYYIDKNGVCNNKYGNYMLSTVIKYLAESPNKFAQLGEVIIIINFIFSMMWYFSYRGILFNNDGRLAFPITMYVFCIMLVSIIWIIPHFSLSHYTAAFLIISSGQIFALMANNIYKELVQDTQVGKIFNGFTWSGLAIYAATLLISATSTKIKKGLSNKIIASLEILHIIWMGVLLFIFIFFFPSLPSSTTLQLPFTKKEATQEITLNK